MIIERMKEEDLPEVVQLFDAYRCFYEQSSDVHAATQFLKARFVNKESIIFVAKIDNTCVGFTQLYPTFSSVSLKRAFILNDLYVAETYRRQGIAEKLMMQAIQFAKEQAASFLTLETGVTNKKAQALYEKAGMEAEENVKHYTYYC